MTNYLVQVLPPTNHWRPYRRSPNIDQTGFIVDDAELAKITRMAVGYQNPALVVQVTNQTTNAVTQLKPKSSNQAAIDTAVTTLEGGAPSNFDTLGEITTVLLALRAATDTTFLTAMGLVFGPNVGSNNWLKAWGANVDALIRATSITRDANGAATAANIVWPDGTAGTYVGTASTAFPGAIDSYVLTYVGSTTKTVTQPAMTRDSTTGAVTTRPAITVA